MSSSLENKPLASGLKSECYAGLGIPRPVEFVLAIAALAFLSPLLLGCAVLVLLSSPGPLLFCQQRVGRGGEVFCLYKFRTMFVTNGGLLVTASTDKRITRIGRFLRKWKMDELPEIYNVLKGEMSFVGPRPEVPELVDFSNRTWEDVLSVRPGITDPVTLTLRNEEAVLAMAEDKELFYRETIQPYKLKGYIEYLEGKSIRTDLVLVARTLKVILKTVPDANPIAKVDPRLVD
jgi:lipopolysaccharide/colanic/teichoic acid biosynthesis glycosyltransferase